MQIDDFKNYTTECFRDAVPPCTCACPLGLDVRAVVEKLQRGNFTAAYRLYRNQTLFPGIVSRICTEPCREVCVRGKVDTSVHMRALEAACVAFTKDSDPIAYNVPKKDFTIAVVGAGLSGLSCALKLASRNYTVKVYEREATLGGRLHGLLEPEIFLAEIEKQFSSVDCEFLPATPVNSLDDIKADAVYIASGPEGDGFGLTASTDKNALATSRTGVFLGGGILGATPVEAIEHGVRASYSIEKFLKTGAMDGVPETWARPQLNKEFYGLPVPPQASPLDAEDDGAATPETAADESRRCLRCNCSLCRDECGLMQKFGLYPPRITTDVTSTMRAMDKFSGRIASRMINSCSQCGLCKTVCPGQIDMEDCFLEARRMLHRDGAMPPVYHDFWMRDMAFSNTDARTVYTPKETCAYLFFPGCQLGASDPAYVVKTYDALSARYPDTALVAGCCGVPAEWAGDEPLRDGVLELLRHEWEKLGKPVVVLACPTCRKTLRRYLPECATLSLYELLAEADIRPEAGSPDPVHIFDSCASRHDPLMQQSVRTLAQRAGLAADEPDGSAGTLKCCGYGGHIHAVNPELADALTAKQAGVNDTEYITYCTNCRDSFAVAGKACRHILDVLFTGNPPDRKPPSLTQRRRNRLDIRREFARRAGMLCPELPQGERMKLQISEDLSAKMDRLLILEDEVQQAVLHCESSGDKLQDTASGRFIGHHKIGLITYWVTYTKDDGGYTLHNIYTHRLTIDE